MPMPEHVRRLRQQVGSELLLVPSVSVLVRDGQERVLLVRHVDSGRWGLVGGAVEVDERPADAAVRETLEETGLDVEVRGPIAAVGGPRYRVRYPNGDETAYVAVVYEAVVLGGVARPDQEETSDLRWFDLEELEPLDLGSFARATFEDVGWLPAG